MEICIDSRQKRIDIDQVELRKKAERILEDLGCDTTTALSVMLVDATEMAELNRVYRGKEGPTNVLSFSQLEGADLQQHPNLLGDVVICTDRAADDAAELGYTEEEMLLYLLIHGILHLLGHVHDEPMEAATMQQRVDAIFADFYPPPD
ncbi:MAG: rRNA maturation RNase YbeY [Desulfomonile tiedjei]|nr:rRNA maturation RNase YbeY [Desulfomonile tiedjei]